MDNDYGEKGQEDSEADSVKTNEGIMRPYDSIPVPVKEIAMLLQHLNKSQNYIALGLT